MPTVILEFDDPSIALDCRALEVEERLGEATRLSLEAFAAEPVDGQRVVGTPAAVHIEEVSGSRAIRGTVTRFTAIATSQPEAGRRYRLELCSGTALLALTRRSRVFQNLSVPDIVTQVLEGAGWPSAAIDKRLAAIHAPRRYLVQYDEDDETFLRRLCEDEGLYFHFRVTGEGETFVLEDTSTNAAPWPQGALVLGDDAGLSPAAPTARRPSARRRRCVGKVTLRDYERKKPALRLEGVAEDGTDLEKSTEVYAAPGGFADPAAGAARARLRLEALRAEALRVSFDSNATSLAPGDLVEIQVAESYDRSPRLEGEYFVVAIEQRWRFGAELERRVTCIPRAVPFRLPPRTPRPRITGVHLAFVTGPAGAEIHPDEDGCLFVRFLWDREGPTDEHSSLPVRSLQPNLPGSMALPRVGWEVLVAFEDGDPDRPYILGRLYNGKWKPPVALPANKTMTSLQSFASPGGGRHNTVSFDDAAGRQHVSISAGFALSRGVGNDMKTQTAKVEKTIVHASQTRTVGADEAISVTQAYTVHAASQTATVAGKQEIFVAGNYTIDVGSEAVLVGAALLEKVGNPVKGALNLGVSAALAGVGAVGDALGPIGGLVAQGVQMAGGIGWSMYQAATAPGAGPNAARNAGIRGVLGIGAGLVPGADSLLATATSFGLQFPWEAPPAGSGGAKAGGGAGGAASDAAAAAGPGPGHRNEKVGGAMAEAIAGSHTIITPGEIKFQTTGASMTGVGASNSTKCVKYGVRTLGAATETTGSHHIKTSADITRTSKAAIRTTVAGALKAKAGGGYSIKSSGKISIEVGGSLKMQGSHVSFVVGGASLSSSPGGVEIKAGSITVNKDTSQNGTTTHQ